MTKTLTKQWRDGTLPAGFYYLKMKDGLILTDHTIYIVGEKQYRWELSSIDYVDEVLAPVPSYDEYKELVSKTDKLEKMAFHYTPEEWNTMMRMVQRLQEQLKEANEVIKWYAQPDTGNAKDYLEKWGVK